MIYYIGDMHWIRGNYQIKAMYSYDDEVEVWIGEGLGEYEGIILEGKTFTELTKRIEIVMEDWKENN